MGHGGPFLLSHLPISLDLWTPALAKHGMAAETHPAGTVGLFEIQGTQILVSSHPQGVSQFRKNLKYTHTHMFVDMVDNIQ
jgi:hypothetical protein